MGIRLSSLTKLSEKVLKEEPQSSCKVCYQQVFFTNRFRLRCHCSKLFSKVSFHHCNIPDCFWWSLWEKQKLNCFNSLLMQWMTTIRVIRQKSLEMVEIENTQTRNPISKVTPCNRPTSKFFWENWSLLNKTQANRMTFR